MELKCFNLKRKKFNPKKYNRDNRNYFITYIVGEDWYGFPIGVRKIYSVNPVYYPTPQDAIIGYKKEEKQRIKEKFKRVSKIKRKINESL